MYRNQTEQRIFESAATDFLKYFPTPAALIQFITEGVLTGVKHLINKEGFNWDEVNNFIFDCNQFLNELPGTEGIEWTASGIAAGLERIADFSDPSDILTLTSTIQAAYTNQVKESAPLTDPTKVSDFINKLSGISAVSSVLYEIAYNHKRNKAA